MRIRKLHVLTDDLEGTEKFYGETLGLSILYKSATLLTLKVGETELSFHQSNQQKPQYHFAFNIPCNQLAEALAWMKGRAELINIKSNELLADFKNWNAEAFYFLDNNENILELIARRDLHNESEKPFDAHALLSVSEIGIVSDNVEDQCRFLKEQYSVDYFAKQPPLPRFAALGDDEGLFIVVPHSREWYPTRILSSKHWVKVNFECNGKEEVLELYHTTSH